MFEIKSLVEQQSITRKVIVIMQRRRAKCFSAGDNYLDKLMWEVLTWRSQCWTEKITSEGESNGSGKVGLSTWR